MSAQEKVARLLLEQMQRRGTIPKYLTWETIQQPQRDMFMRNAAEILDELDEIGAES